MKRKKTDRNLQLFWNLVNQSNDAVFVIDPQTSRFLDFNNKACTSLGYVQEELISMRVKDIEAVLPDSFSWKKHVQEVRKKGNMVLEGRHKRKDSSTFPVEVSVRYISLDNRDYIVAIVRDISDRKKIEERLMKEKLFSESAINSLPGIFYLFDKNGNILRWNKNYEKISEYSSEEILKLNPLDLVPDEDREITKEKIETAFLEGNATLEANILTKSGKKIPYDFTGLRLIVNGKKYIVGMGTDITERKRAEEKLKKYQKHLEELVEKRTAELLRINKELQESEEKYRTLIENIPQKIFLKDRNSVYISCNENYAKDLKITSKQISGMTDYEFFPTELAEKYRSDDKRILQLGVIEEIEEPYMIDGKQVWVYTVKTPVKDEKGKIWGILGIFWDITERKLADEALKKREMELRIKTRSLEEVNIALKIMLKKKDEIKTEIEKNILNNVKELVFPYLEKLKKYRLDEEYNAYLNTLESNLNDIISSFSQKLSSKYLNLTPTEIRIANLIRHGNNTKEIAELLFLSKTTIDFHRRNIRKKLGIKNKKTNLRTHLLFLT